MVVGPQGRILGNLTEDFIAKTFNIVSHHKLVKINIEEAKDFYTKDPDKALAIINSNWIAKTKPHYSNFTKQLHRSDFKLEYNDMITLLGRIMGLKESFIFKNCMFYVI